jgi:hypothetical protein
VGRADWKKDLAKTWPRARSEVSVPFRLACATVRWCETRPWFATSVLVDPEVRLARAEDVERLTGREPPQLRHHDLDQEASAEHQVRRGVAEARDLCLLRREVHDRVEDQVHDREGILDRRRREVADRRRRVWRGAGSTIAPERSIACTGTPRPASGSATLPVPMPNSRARSFPASSARKSTVGPRTSGSNLSAASSSYVAATGSSK